MDVKVYRRGVYAVSEDVVARDIEGEIIIVPLIAGIGDLEDDLFTLNDTGKAIWEKLDGHRTLNQIIQELSSEYQAPDGEIEHDVLGLVQELINRRIVVARSS
jgi:coenzyme PQQ biosynthesis protein PqqD